jgi:hypothetical protein
MSLRGSNLRKYAALPPIHSASGTFDRTPLKSRLAPIGGKKPRSQSGILLSSESRHSIQSLEPVADLLNFSDMTEVEIPNPPDVDLYFLTVAAVSHPIDEYRSFFGSTDMFHFANVTLPSLIDVPVHIICVRTLITTEKTHRVNVPYNRQRHHRHARRRHARTRSPKPRVKHAPGIDAVFYAIIA